MVTTTSSSGMRSSMLISPSKGTIRVRRSSPYFSTISASSSETMPRWRSGEAMISRRSLTRARSSSDSSWILRRSRAARRRSWRERMASAWASSTSSSPMRPVRASSVVGERRMRAITASRASIALSRPSRMWRRSSALRRRKRERRTMTSIWWATQWRTKPSRLRVRGTPSTRASMLAGKLS